MDFLEGVGGFMAREGIVELEILDGDRILRIRRGTLDPSGPLEEEDTGLVRAPLGGILRLSPSPEERPFAPVGEARKEDDVLFCVEAMKHLNEVRADGDLVVEEVLAKEGDAVQEGQAIMRVLRLDGRAEGEG
mgnify:CR=1 FL=1